MLAGLGQRSGVVGSASNGLGLAQLHAKQDDVQLRASREPGRHKPIALLPLPRPRAAAPIRSCHPTPPTPPRAGPVVAEAIFLNREEVPVKPLYYDPGGRSGASGWQTRLQALLWRTADVSRPLPTSPLCSCMQASQCPFLQRPSPLPSFLLQCTISA